MDIDHLALTTSPPMATPTTWKKYPRWVAQLIEYRPFDANKAQIRLLRVLNTDNHNTVRLVDLSLELLQTYNLSECLPFICLSYGWGRSDHQERHISRRADYR
jgi:hypothetical protein